MNDVKLAGRIGNDLTLRYTNEQTAVLNVRLSVDRIGRDEPDWFDVTIWGKTAEAVAAYCAKGDQLIVTDASLRPDHIDVAGKKYATVAIHAHRVEFGATARRNLEPVS